MSSEFRGRGRGGGAGGQSNRGCEALLRQDGSIPN